MNDNIFEFDKIFDTKDYLFSYGPFLTEQTSQRQAEFLEIVLDLQVKHKILDLACGFGRISNILSSKGYSITGIDNSNDFLEIARKNAQEKSLLAEYLCQDMRNLNFNCEFDVIINIFTSFGYFEDEENFKIIKGVSLALKRGGKFLIDMFNRDYIIRNFQTSSFIKRDGGYLAEINQFDILKSINKSERYIINNGNIKIAKLFIRAYTFTEMSSMFKAVGMKVIATYGNFDLSEPYSFNSRRMIIVAVKE